MSRKRREKTTLDDLRRELTRAIVFEHGISEKMAMPIVQSVVGYLQSRYRGERLYVPAPPRQYDVLQIRAALERGEPVPRVMATFSVSRSKLYSLFPEGLPKKQRNAGASSISAKSRTALNASD